MICRHCKALKPHPNQDASKSPSTLSKHLESCIPYLRAKRERTREDYASTLDQLWGIKEDASDSITGSMTDEKLREQVLRIIIDGNLSFAQAENEELQKLLRHAYPGVVLPNRRSVAASLEENVKQVKIQLKEELADVDSQIHLAIDCWSARGVQHQAFIGNTPCFAPLHFWSKLKCNVPWPLLI